MTTIYFVRHGQASYGAESYDKLSAKGEQQAQYLGQYLKKILKNTPYVVAGGMQRHQQTAQFALTHSFLDANVHTDAGWNEFNHEQVFSNYEKHLKTEQASEQHLSSTDDPREYLAKIFGAAIARWTDGAFDQHYDEAWPAFKQRVEQALDRLYNQIAVEQPRAVVVFTSGGVISVVAGLLLGLTPAKTFELNWSVVNSSLTTIRVHQGQAPQLLSFNEHHFIQSDYPELLTWL